ncbi:ubiquinol oxidase subunit II [Verticiella sediminum]
MVVMSPSGDIAMQQRDLIIWSVILMLIIIVPVIFLTLLFAWRYRASANRSDYDPEWHHSTVLELIIWSAPLLIIIALGAMTWVSTHRLDPYRPIERIAPDRPVAADVQPLEVQVVAMNWKWLFLYPEQGIATVNELAAPVDRPIQFKITSDAIMNSFFIPALAGQVYAMSGMQTQLHAVINQEGVYEGFSGNYSGAGFSHMRFNFRGMSESDFDRWVESVRGNDDAMTRESYLVLSQPSARDSVRYFGQLQEGLFDAVVNRCVEPNRMCMRDMMAIDAQGGMGIPGLDNLTWLDADTMARLGIENIPLRAYVGGMCTAADVGFGLPQVSASAAAAASPVTPIPARL